MTFDDAKRRLQQFLTDGLVIVIGSGLSVAEGIPGMTELASALANKVPSRLIDADDSARWELIESDLQTGAGLEAALLKHPPTVTLGTVIVEETTQFLLPYEQGVVAQVAHGNRKLRLSRLFPHLLKDQRGIPIVTPNYDRLIEVAAESVGLGVDSMFAGASFGRFDEVASRESFLKDVSLVNGRKSLRKTYRDRVLIFKPHGSFDWYNVGGTPYRIPFVLNQLRLIITPGALKYVQGYAIPFDRHRERANASIDAAARFLIIGYGFNDDHLEVHLARQIRAQVPALVITHSLSERGRNLLANLPTAIVVESAGSSGQSRISIGSEELIVDGDLWDLNDFVNEVLEP